MAAEKITETKSTITSIIAKWTLQLKVKFKRVLKQSQYVIKYDEI